MIGHVNGKKSSVAQRCVARNKPQYYYTSVRHRTKLSKNCCARKTIIAATFKLMTEAEKRWKKLNGAKRLAQIIHLEKFVDGVHIEELKQRQLNKAA